MSGGALDYAYSKVEEAADRILTNNPNKLHKEFAEHLKLVAKALHDLEWEYSSDYSPGDANEAILNLLRIKTIVYQTFGEDNYEKESEEAPQACFCDKRAVLGPIPQDGSDAEVQFTHSTGCPENKGPNIEETNSQSNS